jgi:hypothetical protein
MGGDLGAKSAAASRDKYNKRRPVKRLRENVVNLGSGSERPQCFENEGGAGFPFGTEPFGMCATTGHRVGGIAI